VINTGLFGLVALFFPLLSLGVLLIGIFFAVRAAVEGGVRRALRDDLLRPSARDRPADPRYRPPTQDDDEA
jgi:hypothetical protein